MFGSTLLWGEQERSGGRHTLPIGIYSTRNKEERIMAKSISMSGQVCLYTKNRDQDMGGIAVVANDQSVGVLKKRGRFSKLHIAY